ncbi:hypothetical protein llg_17270 [Luteolibacter sp. LG18]|nr:hypothetical protein llg_17270 [Luteolibacter sp. LG18]
MEALAIPGFEIGVPRWFGQLPFPLLEYKFGKTDHDINRAGDPITIRKNVDAMEGTSLSRESLLYLSKVSEIGHTIIPHIWPSHSQLRKGLRLGTQHLDTLNEVWWLARWLGIDDESVEHEKTVDCKKENLAKPKPSSVDWKFTVLGNQVSINLEVKNRKGTIGCTPFKKRAYLFGDNPEKSFGISRHDEINVLAITAYHGGSISSDEEASLVRSYFEGLEAPVVDAVAIIVRCGSNCRISYEKLYFPSNRDLANKDSILRIAFNPMDREDHSKFGMVSFPMSIEETLKSMRTGADGFCLD